MNKQKRIVFALILLLSLLVAGYLSYGHTPVSLGWSDVTEVPDSTTYVSAQGFHFEGQDDATKPGRLVSVTPRGNTKWEWNGYSNEPNWFYDVEPINKTHLFVTLSQKNHTEGVMYNTSNQSITWNVEFPEQDTHDIDFEGSEVYVAPMKSDYYEDGQKVFDDKAYIYNRSSENVTWEWHFRDYYDTPEGNPQTGWTHLNDIDKVNESTVMLSPRNLDQVIFVDIESGEIVNRLGEEGNTDILNHQHNPDIVSTNPLTVIVADSENDRVVEYEYTDGTWNMTWKLTGSLNWPRDADRLSDGNTLITDTLNHRVVEVTPEGEVVWEYFAPWAPYDADRGFDGSKSPTMEETNLSNTSHKLKGGSIGEASQRSVAGESHVCGVSRDVPNPAGFSTYIETKTEDTALEEFGKSSASVYSHHIQWIKPRWMSPWSVPAVALAMVVSSIWIATELATQVRKRRS